MVKQLTISEVEEALAHMSLKEVSGPDGFPVEFDQAFWTTVIQLNSE